jgi:type I restriction-modification system DNA methylase subunit
LSHLELIYTSTFFLILIKSLSPLSLFSTIKKMLSASSSASTTEQRIFLSIEETWNAYKTKRTALELYTADAVIMYVPTSIGVRGNAQIRKFFLNNQFSEKINPVSETIYNTLTGGNKLIEEVVWSIHFHTGECRWLLPNIEERFLVMKKKV